MAGAVALHVGGDHAARFEGKAATRETPLVKWTIIGLALTFFAIFLLLPLLAVFVEAFLKGWETYLTALTDPDAPDGGSSEGDRGEEAGPNNTAV